MQLQVVVFVLWTVVAFNALVSLWLLTAIVTTSPLHDNKMPISMQHASPSNRVRLRQGMEQHPSKSRTRDHCAFVYDCMQRCLALSSTIEAANVPIITGYELRRGLATFARFF
jgi:hypothetical protein